MIFCYTRSLNSLDILSNFTFFLSNLTNTFTCFYQSHLIIGCAQLSGETRSLATFRMHWQEPRKEKRRQSEPRDFSDHFRTKKYMGTMVNGFSGHLLENTNVVNYQVSQKNVHLWDEFPFCKHFFWDTLYNCTQSRIMWPTKEKKLFFTRKIATNCTYHLIHL